VFKNGEVIESGVTGLSIRRKVEPEVRISRLIESLNVLASQWRPQIVALCQPPASTGRFRLWTCWCLRWLNGQRSAGFPSSPTLAQEVRAAIAGHPNASRDQLGYATMLLLGLIGQGRSTHEWEAIAVGHYHQTRSN